MAGSSALTSVLSRQRPRLRIWSIRGFSLAMTLPRGCDDIGEVEYERPLLTEGTERSAGDALIGDKDHPIAPTIEATIQDERTSVLEASMKQGCGGCPDRPPVGRPGSDPSRRPREPLSPRRAAMNIVVIASHPASLVDFRGEMLKAMVARGHEVVAAAPDERESVRIWLADIGVRFVGIPMARAGLDPIDDLRTLKSLHALVREARADVVLAYTAKPVIYGLLGARLAGVPLRVALISGRGSALAGGMGLKRRLLARLMGTMYAVALRGAHIVFFQNPDDEQLFRASGLVGRGQRRVRIERNPESTLSTTPRRRCPTVPWSF